MTSKSSTDIEALKITLESIRSYDISSWAAFATTSDSTVSYDDMMHLGTIWKLAAEIYACRLTQNLTEDSELHNESPSVHKLIAAYAFLERKDDELIKCLIWPTFIAGAASTSSENRAWVLKTLDRIWQVGHCANTKNAAEVLRNLWKKQGQSDSGSSHIFLSESSDQECTDPPDWDWMGELSKEKGSWLFV